MKPGCGCSTITIVDEFANAQFPALVFYPSNSPESAQQLGPYTLDAALNGDIAAGPFPMVVVSHFSGGSHLFYRNMGAYLARNGFVVVCPEHSGNNRDHNELARTDKLLTERPRQLQLVIDFMLKRSMLNRHICQEQVAIIGHSIGGYTALAVAGGRPSTFSREKTGGTKLQLAFKDDRVKALVLLAPATIWYRTSDALDEVNIPILMLTAAEDEQTRPVHGEIVKDRLPKGILKEHRVVPNAGHFSFLSPFPEALIDPQFLPSQDPPGFDRPEFHRKLNPEILSFLQRYLS